MKFWDSSAIVPLCIQETATETVQDILHEDPSLVLWWGTRTECTSAFMRRVREGHLTPNDARVARHALDAVVQAGIEIQPSESVRATAERLLGVHSVRAADALQLAAAVQWCQGLTAGNGLVVFDRRLREVGYAEGFTVFPDTL
ncbi:MAG: type II toxin-antitoxin system VapC family toxin [Deltaproteobacteria bacterium]|nr:type II toxin-antitoxin system VapC family toxin [Deltaproteobacteria bacterium]